VISRLADGGMANVLLARVVTDTGFERVVAIKWLRSRLAHLGPVVRMFLAEARLTALLHHPNIVAVHDLAEAEGRYFMAMEYVKGWNVRALWATAALTRTPVPIDVALAIVGGAAAGLHYAHEARGPDGAPLDLVHHDVSPANLMVSDQGHVKLLDFGIAQSRLSPRTSQQHVVLGTGRYMSPEAVRQERVDRRADIYALGVILYELSTGRQLFVGGDSLQQIAAGKVAPPSHYRAGYPPALEAIVLKALATDPRRRYQTARELAGDLDALAAQLRLPISASRVAGFVASLFGNRDPAVDAPAPAAPSRPPATTAPGRRPAAVMRRHPRATSEDITTLSIDKKRRVA
jgi:eukaryotic-like serine/threonine-protein kinase